MTQPNMTLLLPLVLKIQEKWCNVMLAIGVRQSTDMDLYTFIVSDLKVGALVVQHVFSGYTQSPGHNYHF